MSIPETIYQQLGGSEFAAMTGAKFVGDGNKLRVHLTRNHSKANRLDIELMPDDLYAMRFYRYTAPRLNKSTWEFTPEKVTEIERYEGVYCDQLRGVYERVTWQRTSLTEVFYNA